MSTPRSDPESEIGSNKRPTTRPKNGANDRSRNHGDGEGEDEGGAPTEGDYSGLKDNQKPVD